MLRQLKCCPTVVRITQTDRMSAWAALSAIAIFYLPTCIVLYTHHCSRLNYCSAGMRCSVSHTRNTELSHMCDKHISTTTNVVDGNWAVTVINKLRPPQTLYIPPPSSRSCRCQPPPPAAKLQAAVSR